MATCAVMGQAIGTAAALARTQAGRGIAEIFNPFEIVRLQQRLLRDDAFLPSLRGSDAADLARTAAVTASSATATGAAVLVTDGHTRELLPALGSWADGGTHRWESAALPAWIELTWPEPQVLTEIHLTFDSGFQRELILTASDFVSAKTIRGAQPELVRDYDLLVDDHVILSVTANHLRKRVHRLPEPIPARRLRLAVKSTHGVPSARIFEVRAYGAV
jgi:hypothetical protein